VTAPRASRTAAARLLALGLGLALLGACSGDDGDTAADATNSTETTGTTAAEEPTTTQATYVVPAIDPAAVPEICDATKAITEADTALSQLLTPLLGQDDSPAADQALLAALPQVTPLIEQAQQGYARMAAVLPPDLAADARKVSEATKAFYDSVVASKTIDDAIAAVQSSQGPANDAKESAAHIEATVKATCNLSLYS
jgi:hypothetical protein